MVISGSEAEWIENVFQDWLRGLSTDLSLALPPNLLPQMWAGSRSYFHSLKFVLQRGYGMALGPAQWVLWDCLLTEAPITGAEPAGR